MNRSTFHLRIPREWMTLLFFLPFLLSGVVSQIFITCKMAADLVTQLQVGVEKGVQERVEERFEKRVEEGVSERVEERFEKSAKGEKDRNAEFAPQVLAFSGLVGLYIFVCAAALLYFCAKIKCELTSITKRTGNANLGVSLILAVSVSLILAVCIPILYVFGNHIPILLYVFGDNFLRLSQITLSPIELYAYSTHNICEAMRYHLLWDELNRGRLLVILPWLVGTITGTCGALHAALVTKNAIGNANKVDGAFRELVTGMMVLSVILVSSVLLVSVYGHMHCYLFHIHTAYEKFVHAITVFWGATLTATVILVYMPHLLRLNNMAGGTQRQDSKKTKGSEAFNKIGIIFSIIAPLLVAFLTEFLENI